MASTVAVPFVLRFTSVNSSQTAAGVMSSTTVTGTMTMLWLPQASVARQVRVTL
jgi:hypothetical protein